MIGEPKCYSRKCKHLLGVAWLGKEERTERNICVAFTRGIPDEIAFGDNPHTEPFPGDHGIMFELKEG